MPEGSALLHRMVKGSLVDKVTSELRRVNSQSKDPAAGVSLECPRK